MLFNTFPKWDRNRPIYFQIGMIIALTMSNVVINYETVIPDYGVYLLENDQEYVDFNEIYNHAEERIKPAHVIKIKNQSITNIVPISEPVLEQVKFLEPIAKNYVLSSLDKNTIINPYVEKPKVGLKTQSNINDTVWTITERMPCLVECDFLATEQDRILCTQRSLLNMIHSNLRYPTMARETGIEGTVIISFIIDRLGIMKDIMIVRDIGGGCGTEAIKSLRGLSKWSPGRQNEISVNVKYVIPIKFQLYK